MTKYNLAEFQAWLAENPSQKAQVDWNYILINTESWLENLLQKYGHIPTVNQPVNKWRAEVDQRERERERERANEENNMLNAQDWLNQQFPTLESRKAKSTLLLTNSNQPALEGELDLKDFSHLENLTIDAGYGLPSGVWKITKLVLNCPSLKKLKVVWCSQLKEITGLDECLNLVEFDLTNCPQLQSPYTVLDSWKQEITQLKTQLAEYEQPETTSDPQEALNTKIQRKKVQLSQAITSGKKSTAPLRKEIELLEKIQNLETQITEHQQKETNYQQQIQQKDQQINAKQTQLTKLQATEQASKRKITQLEKQITDLQAEKQALQEKMLKERQEALARWEQEKANLTQQIIQLNEQKDTFQKSADYLRATLKGTEKTLEEIKKELAESQEKAQTTAQEKDKLLAAKNEELRQRNEAFKVVSERNVDLGNKLSLASSEISQLAEWISKLEAASAEGNAFQTLQKELTAAQSEIASLQEQLSVKSPKSYWGVYVLLALIALYFLMN